MDIYMNAKIKCKNKDFLPSFAALSMNDGKKMAASVAQSSSTRSDKQKVGLKDKVRQNHMLLLMNYDRYLMISRFLAGLYRKLKENDRLLSIDRI